MNNIKKHLLTISLFLLFVSPTFCLATEAKIESVFYMSNLREKEGIASLKKNAEKIDILAPQFYAISNKLKLTGGLDANLKNVIKQKKVKKVMPLVANQGFKQSIMHNLLTSPKAQDEIIKALVKEALKQKYIGWQFDFENISYKDKDLYSSFIEKTAKSFKKNKLILSIAAVSRYTDYEDTSFYRNWSGAFDYERISKAVDFISLMTYDDPESKGPVASTPYVNKVLEYVKDKIPAEKLSFGIPLYYWGWSLEPLKKIRFNGTYQMVLDRQSKYKNEVGFDESLGTAWISYLYQDKWYKIWYEDKKSFDIRLDIIKQNKLRGFSAWVLGSEDSNIWESLSK